MEKAQSKFLKFQIEDNLAQLFNYFADIGNLNHAKEKYYSWVKAHPAAWPNYIYSLSFSNELAPSIVKELVGLISHDVAPAFIIAGPRLISRHFPDIAMENGIRHIMHWTGMAKKIDLLPEADEYENLKIAIIDNEALLTEWLKITENVLFNGQLQHTVCYWELLKSPFFKLFIALIDGKPVATTLLFINEKTAGIYMVAGLPEYRKAPIAKKILNDAMKYALDAGCKTAILQANAASESFYLSIGFKEYCRFNIFRKFP